MQCNLIILEKKRDISGNKKLLARFRDNGGSLANFGRTSTTLAFIGWNGLYDFSDSDTLLVLRQIHHVNWS